MQRTFALLALAAASNSFAAPWTYQGSLSDGGEPANGRYDLRLTLLNEARNVAVSSPLTLHGVDVRDGQFAVEVDFGFDLATAPVLSIQTEVQQNKSGFAALGAPKRFDAKAALAGVCWDTEGNSGTDPSINFIGTIDAQPLVFRTRNAQSLRIEPSSFTSGGIPTTASIIAGSAGNQIGAGVAGSTISGGGDTGGGGSSVNLVLDNFGTVSGGLANRAGDAGPNTQSAMFAVVSGGNQNTASATSSVVSGGGNNRASGPASVVGGGSSNAAADENATISGGRGNTAGGRFSVVGGGTNNASNNANTVVAGGANNVATGNSAVVGGGASNTAMGSLSAVGGGIFNCAGGERSWAGGTQAKVRPAAGATGWGVGCDGIPMSGAVGDAGTFIWADSQQTDFVSSGTNQFLVRAFGGAVITGSSTANSPEGNRLRIDGTLRVDSLGSAGSTSLCRNASNQIASCSSSARYKQQITDLELGLAAVMALRPVAYRWKESGAADVGFVAEEVAELDERLIVRNEAGAIEGVRYERLSALLAGAVQELATREALAQQERDELAARLAHLEQRLGWSNK